MGRIKRYSIMAKRRDTNEEWTDWTEADTYEKAEEHARYCESVGYAAKVQADDALVELWGILGGKSYENAKTADAIYDAGFRKESAVVAKMAKRIDQFFAHAIRNCVKAIRDAKDEEDYKSVLDYTAEKELLEVVRYKIAAITDKFDGGDEE